MYSLFDAAFKYLIELHLDIFQVFVFGILVLAFSVFIPVCLIVKLDLF